MSKAAAYAAGWRVVRMLPRPVARAAFAAGADRVARGRGRGVTRLAGNLRRVVGPQVPEPQLRALVRAAMRSYARYWLEFFRLPDRSREQILRDFRLEGEERLAAAVAAGRGVVLALPHAGNWDIAGAWVAAKGWPIVTVAERLEPERLFQQFLDVRQRIGMEIIPLTGGDRPAFEVLLERLAAGYVVPLVADRDLSDSGIDVEFFGERARMPPGPALLAIRSGAPLMTASLWFEPEVAVARLSQPLPVPGREAGPVRARVRQLTQRIADDFAAGIAEHPQDWHMLQRVWPQPSETGT
jgi:KDO2-lipid IV(A) lauroyltransferase